MKHNLLKTTSALVLVTSAAFGAQAQEATVDTELRVQTVTVTATRRDESILDVPINISAVSGDQIQQQGFTELSDVVAYIPGINVVDQGARSGNKIVVRGLNADPIGSEEGNGNGGGGTVATYLGEIPIYIDLKLNDLERVEVLLGPQGTLYGAGTLGGAVRYIPKKPDFKADLLEVRGDAYGYSEADDISSDVGMTFNKQFSDTFAIRGSVDFLNDTGFIDYPYVVRDLGVSEPDPDFSDPAAVEKNLRRVKDANGEETVSGRIAARWQPTSWLDGTLTYYFQNADIEGRTISSKRSTVPAGDYESALRVLEPNARDNQLLALELTADLGFAELTSATGYAKYEEDGQRDQTDLLISLEYSYESFPTFAAYTRELQEDEFINQELRLVSKTEGPLNWIIGGFYNEFEGVATSAEYTPGYNAYAISEYCGGVPSPTDPDCGFEVRPDDLEYFSTDRQKLVESAIYGEIGYDVTDKWSVTLGGRYYDYELKTVSTVDFPQFDGGFMPFTLDDVRNFAFDPTAGQAQDGTLFKINTAYEFTDDLTVYATVSEGYRIGNSNGIAQCDAYDPDAGQDQCALAPGQQYGPNPGDVAQFDERSYGPDQTTNYEIGFKSLLMDGRASLNGSVYFIEWDSPQVSSATVNASIPITINASGAESVGFELAGELQVTEDLSLRSSYSHNETELTEDVPSLIRTILPGGGFSTAFEDGLSGDRLPGSPEDQFSFFAAYKLPVPSLDGDLMLNFGYSWQGDVLTRTGGRGSSLTLDSFGIANASLVYERDNWSLTGYVDNLFDEYAETGVRQTSLYNQTINGANVRSYYTNVLPPRVIGLKGTYRFGG
jgi:iron complex outermembrane recepter protein